MAQNKEIHILKWVGIALACLSTVFTLVIVGSHLSGRLIGLGKVGIIGTVGAELMAIICAWLAASDRKRVAGVAMICQIILTAVLLINASIALDLDWQETLASKASEQQLATQRQAAEEQRKLIEKQAELAGQLAQTDKRLAREFVRSGKATTKLPLTSETETTKPESAPLDIAKLSIYERYGLTIVPLFLGLLSVIALGLAAHSGEASTENQLENRHESTFPARSDADLRSSQRRANFDSRVATQSDATPIKSATQSDAERSSVATQGAMQDGLAILRETLRAIAFGSPGKWFKVDRRPDHILIRLNRREQGREVTEHSGRLTLDVLIGAVQMPREQFRARIERLLKRKGFEI